MKLYPFIIAYRVESMDPMPPYEETMDRLRVATVSELNS